MKIQFENLITPLADEEFKQLTENIIKYGCRDALVIWNDILLDGHNRLKICKENNIKYKIKEIQLKDKNEAEMWIIKNQFARRNLSIFDRSLLAEKLRKLIETKAKERQREGGKNKVVQNSAQPNTRQELAIIAGVSHNTIDKVNAIKDKITSKQKELLQKGKITVHKIHKEIIGEQKKIQKQKEYAEKAKNFKEQNVKIIHGDFRKQNIENNSIDLILTDPPYLQEYLYLWQDLFNVAEKILKPSGFLVAYSGQMHLDKIFKMNNNLIYYWMMNLDFPDNTPHPLINGRGIINEWKPILIFQKPPFKKKNIMPDKIINKYPDKELHDKNWGQTLRPFEKLVNEFSKPNDLVYEPFAGSGTTLLACKNKKRKCIGVEIDKKYINIIKGRLND